MEWISVKNRKKPKHGQKVLVMQDPDLTATKEPLFAIYNSKTKRFMPPEKFEQPIHEHGLKCLGWVHIIYWMPLPPIKYQRGERS